MLEGGSNEGPVRSLQIGSTYAWIVLGCMRVGKISIVATPSLTAVVLEKKEKDGSIGMDTYELFGSCCLKYHCTGLFLSSLSIASV